MRRWCRLHPTAHIHPPADAHTYPDAHADGDADANRDTHTDSDTGPLLRESGHAVHTVTDGDINAKRHSNGRPQCDLNQNSDP